MSGDGLVLSSSGFAVSPRVGQVLESEVVSRGMSRLDRGLRGKV